MSFQVTVATHVGRVRSHNEDAVWATNFELGSEIEVRRGIMPPSGSAALVADGMGGHAGGEVASVLAIELLRPVAASLLSKSAVSEAVNAANVGLFMAMKLNPDLFGMGTTIVGAAFSNGMAYVFNVGDSRAYLHSEAGLIRLSEDHVEDGYILTRCLGGHEQDIVEPSCRMQRLISPCRLLLCSDGLTDMVGDEEIDTILRNEDAEVGSSLLAAALSAGGRDNISAIVIDVA